MSDTVNKRIEWCAFADCDNLEFVRLSQNLEHIGGWTFNECRYLTSLFIPESCREIDEHAFHECTKLIILTIPRHTHIIHKGAGGYTTAVIGDTLIIDYLDFEHSWEYDWEIHEWFKSINEGEEFELHRECASCDPSEDVIYGILKERGPSSFNVKNKIEITPSRYLDENSFSEIEEKKLVNRFIVLDMMGEIHL